MKDEQPYDIAKSIEKHYRREKQWNVPIRAIGRVRGYLKATYPQPGIPEGDTTFWLTNRPSLNVHATYRGDGIPIYKNTKMGEILTKYHQGSKSYLQTTQTKKKNEVSIKIYNKATYIPKEDSITDVTIWCNKRVYRCPELTELLAERLEIEKELECSRKAEEENKRREEGKKKEEEAKRIKDEIKRLEDKLARSNAEIEHQKSFIRDTLALRIQPLLDKYQEDAKRSHLYDGTPIVIEGGPGTGKTTTVIQRLKFLTDRYALEEYKKEDLSPKQIELLTDEKNNSWMFVSPTKLLLQYLRQNMQYEGLRTNTENTNTITIDDFRKKMIREYGLCKPGNSPFKEYKSDKYNVLILDPREVIGSFGKYVVKSITQDLIGLSKLETKSYSWHDKAVRIKSYCARVANINDIYALLDLFYSLQDNEGNHVKELEHSEKEKVKEVSIRIQNNIKSQPEICDKLKTLFAKWRKDRNRIEDEDDPDNEEEVVSKDSDFEIVLFNKLKPLVRRYALTQIDSTFKLSKRQQELYTLVEPFILEIKDWKIIVIILIRYQILMIFHLREGLEKGLEAIIILEK